MSTLTISDIGFTVVAPPQLRPPILKLTVNSKTAGRTAKRLKIWALWRVVHASQHVNFHNFRLWFYRGGATAAVAANAENDCNSRTTGRRAKHRFHRGGATVSTVVTTEIDRNSETAARRAKRTKMWALWGVVYT